MSTKLIDPGRDLLGAVTSWASTHHVPCVRGDYPDEAPTAHLFLDEAADLPSQIHPLLEQLKPSLILVLTSELTADVLAQTVDELTEAGADEARIAAARVCRKFIGHVGSLHITIFVPGSPVALDYLYVAPWVDDAYPDGEDDDEDIVPPLDPALVAEQRRAREERARWTPAARTEAARRIAQDARFPKAKKEADRIVLTRDVLGADAPEDENLVIAISREAASRYSFEVLGNKSALRGSV
ncbi:MAG: hypothetical protein H3C62_05860 [Gemmatimonadaceae bacterium]|nr:hypothetical protein [Gemmatimonadaceae bacterium]